MHSDQLEVPESVVRRLVDEHDPALDLVAAWHLLDEDQRRLLRMSLGCGDIQWRRGMAWALQQSMGLVWYYAESNPAMARWGRRTLDRLLSAWAA
jgi:hypothetical protein